MTRYITKQLNFMLKEVKRELEMRHKKYPGWVGKYFTQKVATKRLVTMEHVQKLIEEQITLKHGSQGQLFGAEVPTPESIDRAVEGIFNDFEGGITGKMESMNLVLDLIVQAATLSGRVKEVNHE